MIRYVVCDLFESPSRVLVNTINTVGVMGKGIAKEFKRIYPQMFHEYQALCERHMLDIGQLHLYRTSNKWILNFPTKKHWRQPSRPEYIEAGLQKFVEVHHLLGITAISFPLLGCGNGELDWESQVQPLMERYLTPLPISVFIHLQFRNDRFTPEHEDQKAVTAWLRGEPSSLAFSEVWADLQEAILSIRLFPAADRTDPFSATTNENGIVIRLGDGGEHLLPTDALLSLWQQLREVGFVSRDNIASGLEPLADYVIAIFEQLPYVKPVEIGTPRDALDVGLRLAAFSAIEPLALLQPRSAVEVV